MSKPIVQSTVKYSGTPTIRRFAGYGANPGLASAGTAAIGVFEVIDTTLGLALITKLGETEVEFGGVVNPGGLIEVGTDGKAVAKSTGVTVGYLNHQEAATANGTIAKVTLLPNS